MFYPRFSTNATDQLSPSVLFAQRDDRFPMCFFPLPLAAAPGWRVEIAFRWPGWNARCKNINFSHCLSAARGGLTRDGAVAHVIMRPSGNKPRAALDLGNDLLQPGKVGRECTWMRLQPSGQRLPHNSDFCPSSSQLDPGPMLL